jgi:hypothetical protein
LRWGENIQKDVTKHLKWANNILNSVMCKKKYILLTLLYTLFLRLNVKKQAYRDCTSRIKKFSWKFRWKVST